MQSRKWLVIPVVLILVIGTAWADRPAIISPTDGDTQLFDDSVGDGGVLASFGPGMAAGADHVVSDQCLDGGWGWLPHADCSATYHNITAPICMGLLNAYSYTSDPDHLQSAIDGGDFDLLSQYGNGEARFGSFTPAFMYRLTAASGDSTYSTFAATDFFDELTAKTYGPSDYDTYGWIGAVQSGRSGAYINLRPWDFHNLPWVAGLIGNSDSTTPPDGVSQQQAFLNAVLDGLDTLDNSDPNNVWWDLIGLAGGVRGLALNGTTSFSAINSPNFSAINGITDLKSLADVLVGYQNSDGSWYWASQLSSPGEDDKDTQTTAYAVMALVAADGVLPAPPYYATEIAKGRDWLRSMQVSGGGFLSYPGGDQNTEVEGEVLNALIPEALITLDPNSTCYQTGATVTVEINMSDAGATIVGGQFFMSYDTAQLTFVGAAAGDAPFTREIYEAHDGVAGTIDYAVGIPDGGTGTSADTTMARITFTASTEICDAAGLVSFRTHSPPSRLSDDQGGPVTPELFDLPVVTIDGTAPVITCPADITVSADAGGCDVTLSSGTIGTATATDNCDPSPTITFTRSDGKSNLTDPYDSADSPITITWRATDACGNYDECQQTITVSDQNELVVDVELSPTMVASVTRCITFELWSGGVWQAEVKQEITFSSGLATGVTVLVPCGSYDCITARDELHTLRRTATPGTTGSEPLQYTADFTAADMLVGGNLNDDQWIDILDFGVFSWQYGQNYGSGDTTCSTPYPHADINGDSVVDAADFTFIQINFLTGRENDCDGSPGPESDPRTRISLDELKKLGMPELGAGDLNNDGWLDEADIEAFFQGVRPKKPVHGPGAGALKQGPSSVRPRR